ncbi:hypothetical protein KL86DPRO_11331 [uncultured delta proteobacterium]|uniref:Uncharacterized protein n=1 Tax=uncultured delta proteobacterium TaxID=34034 RepID=A0A212JFS6_9DELT|nr:hypothetical protein KL86DPRO_11331 [uncultured delta proteobacterium]
MYQKMPTASKGTIPDPFGLCGEQCRKRPIRQGGSGRVVRFRLLAVRLDGAVPPSYRAKKGMDFQEPQQDRAQWNIPARKPD